MEDFVDEIRLANKENGPRAVRVNDSDLIATLKTILVFAVYILTSLKVSTYS